MGLFIIKDETLFGELLQEHPLEIELDTITLRDLISARVTEELRKRSKFTAEQFRYLIDLAPEESRLNAVARKLTGPSPIDPEKPVAAALAAFNNNAFFVLVGDRQVESLDEVIPARQQQEVTFVKLTQLIGG